MHTVSQKTRGLSATAELPVFIGYRGPIDVAKVMNMLELYY